MKTFWFDKYQLRTMADARRGMAEIVDVMSNNYKLLGFANMIDAVRELMDRIFATVPFPVDDRHNLEVAYMEMDMAVKERKEVLEAADVYRWCAYKGYAPPEGKAEEGRRRRQMMKEVAECPYVSPEHRAAARAHLPRTKRKKPE